MRVLTFLILAVSLLGVSNFIPSSGEALESKKKKRLGKTRDTRKLKNAKKAADAAAADAAAEGASAGGSKKKGSKGSLAKAAGGLRSRLGGVLKRGKLRISRGKKASKGGGAPLPPDDGGASPGDILPPGSPFSSTCILSEVELFRMTKKPIAHAKNYNGFAPVAAMQAANIEALKELLTADHIVKGIEGAIDEICHRLDNSVGVNKDCNMDTPQLMCPTPTVHVMNEYLTSFEKQGSSTHPIEPQSACATAYREAVLLRDLVVIHEPMIHASGEVAIEDMKDKLDAFGAEKRPAGRRSPLAFENPGFEDPFAALAKKGPAGAKKEAPKKKSGIRKLFRRRGGSAKVSTVDLDLQGIEPLGVFADYTSYLHSTLATRAAFTGARHPLVTLMYNLLFQAYHRFHELFEGTQATRPFPNITSLIKSSAQQRSTQLDALCGTQITKIKPKPRLQKKQQVIPREMLYPRTYLVGITKFSCDMLAHAARAISTGETRSITRMNDMMEELDTQHKKRALPLERNANPISNYHRVCLAFRKDVSDLSNLDHLLNCSFSDTTLSTHLPPRPYHDDTMSRARSSSSSLMSMGPFNPYAPAHEPELRIYEGPLPDEELPEGWEIDSGGLVGGHAGGEDGFVGGHGAPRESQEGLVGGHGAPRESQDGLVGGHGAPRESQGSLVADGARKSTDDDEPARPLGRARLLGSATMHGTGMGSSRGKKSQGPPRPGSYNAGSGGGQGTSLLQVSTDLMEAMLGDEDTDEEKAIANHMSFSWIRLRGAEQITPDALHEVLSTDFASWWKPMIYVDDRTSKAIMAKVRSLHKTCAKKNKKDKIENDLEQKCNTIVNPQQWMSQCGKRLQVLTCPSLIEVLRALGGQQVAKYITDIALYDPVLEKKKKKTAAMGRPFTTMTMRRGVERMVSSVNAYSPILFSSFELLSLASVNPKELIGGRVLHRQLSPETRQKFFMAFEVIIHPLALKHLNQMAPLYLDARGRQRAEGGLAEEIDKIIKKWTKYGMNETMVKKLEKGENLKPDDFAGTNILTMPVPTRQRFDSSVGDAVKRHMNNFEGTPENIEVARGGCSFPLWLSNALTVMHDSRHQLQKHGVENMIFLAKIVDPGDSSLRPRGIFSKMWSGIKKGVKSIFRLPPYQARHFVYAGLKVREDMVSQVIQQLATVYNTNQSYFKNEISFRRAVNHLLLQYENVLRNPMREPFGVPMTSLLDDIHPNYALLGGKERLREFQASGLHQVFAQAWALAFSVSMNSYINPDMMMKMETQFSKDSWEKSLNDNLSVNSFRMVFLGSDLPLKLYDQLIPADQKQMLKRARYGVATLFAYQTMFTGRLYMKQRSPMLGNYLFNQGPYFGDMIVRWQKKRKMDRLIEIISWLTLGLFFLQAVCSTVSQTAQVVESVTQNQSSLAGQTAGCPPMGICSDGSVGDISSSPASTAVGAVAQTAFAVSIGMMFGPALAVWKIAVSHFKILSRFEMAVGNAFRSIGRWFKRRFHERWFSKKQNAKIQEEMKRQDEKLKASQKALMAKKAHDLVDQVVPQEDVDYDQYLESVPPPDASLVAAPVEIHPDEDESDLDEYYNDDSRWEVDGPGGVPPPREVTEFLEIDGGEGDTADGWISRIQPRKYADVKRHQFLLARMSDL
ncbi:cytoadherence-linked asexual protein [Cystoisospora suis]|uniref:Cytoadherence-linked asexual protein n=1 Tax=Cystoisospora suis TaxID=483139 RepID=A0A2C6LEN2_9APIC|nr:cytoadherence-linked asexual protein [Cystoisospora suis]